MDEQIGGHKDSGEKNADLRKKPTKPNPRNFQGLMEKS